MLLFSKAFEVPYENVHVAHAKTQHHTIRLTYRMSSSVVRYKDTVPFPPGAT